MKEYEEIIIKAAENNWDEINSQFKDGLNPYAHKVGFIEGVNWVIKTIMEWNKFKDGQDSFNGKDHLNFEQWLIKFKNLNHDQKS